MPCEYAYGLTKLFFSANAIALQDGGQFTSGGTLKLTLYGQNRAGYTVASDEVIVSYTATQAIQIILPEANRTAATDFHYYILCKDGIQIASWQNYDYAVDADGRVTSVSLRTLTPLRLFRDAHIESAPSVNAPTDLPNGTDLVEGMVRLINYPSGTAPAAYYRYAPRDYRKVDDLEVLTPPGRTTQKWVRSKGNPYLNTVTSVTGSAGCAHPVTAVSPEVVLPPPKYPMDGSPTVMPLKLYWRNDSTTAIPLGSTFGIELRQAGVIKSQLYDKLAQVRPMGFVNLVNGELVVRDRDNEIIDELGTWRTWEYGVRGILTLREDLQPGQAYFVEVALQFRSDQVAAPITEGTQLSVVLFPFAQSGNFAGDLWEFSGGKDLVFYVGDRLLVVPNESSGVDVLGGAAMVQRFSFPERQRRRVYGIAPNLSNQKITIDGNGSIFYRGTSTPPTSEAIRALVSCKPGYSLTSDWLPITINTGDAISLQLTYPTAIRDNYPAIGGNPKGRFNLHTLAIFIRYGNVIYQAAAPAIANPIISTLAGLTQAGTIPLPPDSDFCLFAPPDAIAQRTVGGTLPAGNYEVCLGYYLDGTIVSNISHDSALGCIATIPDSFDKLFAMLDSFAAFKQQLFAYTDKAQQFTRAQTSDVVTLSSVNGLLSIDCSRSNYFRLVLTENITRVAITNLSLGSRFDLSIRQDGIGGRAIAGWGNVAWPRKLPPTITAAANSRDLLSFTSDDGVGLAGVYAQNLG
jgi:hypothetical protein